MTSAKRTRVTVPKEAIRWLIARLHVGTPDTDIEADIRRRCADRGTKAVRNAAVKYALKCHKENQALYDRVLSGH